MRLFIAMMFVIATLSSAQAADELSDVEKRHQAIEAGRIESLKQHQLRQKELAAQPLPCVTPEECAKVAPPPPPAAVTEEQQEQQLETQKVQDEKSERRKGHSGKPFKTTH